MLHPRLLLSLVAAAALASTAQAESNWPRFQGPDGSGHTAEKGFPKTWTAADVQWRCELGGIGQSSPIIWNDRIFVTTSEKLRDGNVARYVICVDRNNGEVLWKQHACSGAGEDLHTMNTFATPSCATDGERVVAYFGPGGLFCYDFEGNKQWSREKLVRAVGPWGFGASPIIDGDLVIQNCDAEGASYLLAVDKKTGEDVWKTARRELPRGGWSTPIIIETPKRREMILNGEFGVQAYDPATGEDLWFCKSFDGRGEPIPAYANGLLITVSGKPADVYAVRPGGSGDVTATHMQWHTPRRGGRDLPSPTVVGNYCLVSNMVGVATMYEPTTGKAIWTSRLGGNFSASPVVSDGLIYLQSEGGEVFVIRPGDKRDIVAKNPLGSTGEEIFRASPALSDGQIFCRSTKALYCVGKRNE